MAKKSAAAEIPAAMKSGSELIREQLSKGNLKPADIIAAIKSESGVDVGKALVNGVKMNWKKKGGLTAPKISKQGRAGAEMPVEVRNGRQTFEQRVGNGKQTFEHRVGNGMTQIDAVILLVEQFGAEKAKEIISVLWHEVGNA